MGLSATHLLLLLLVVVLLFGRGKISDLMGDVGRGIKSFKNAMAEDNSAAQKSIDQSGQAESERDKSKTG